MDMTTTPSPDVVFSVIRASADLGTELPKRKERWVSGLSQTRRRACAARRSSAWTVRWKAPAHRMKGTRLETPEHGLAGKTPARREHEAR
jgi:hypothetical protein